MTQQPGQITFFVNQPKLQHPNNNNNMLTLKKIEHFSYILTDQIGLGFSSHVYKGKNDRTNEIVAIKVIDLKGVEEMQFLNDEVTALERIKKANPINLLKLEGVFKTKNNLYIITEFCEGKDIAKILRKKKNFSQAQAQSIMKQFICGYSELYKLQIVHRDLKLANIFVKNGVIKIADFGFALGAEACLLKMEYNVGSPTYMSPEALKYNNYSYKSDVWAIGVIAYELVYGRPPWKNKNDSVLYEMLHNTPIQTMLTNQVKISEEYKHFIKKCLTLDVQNRANPEFVIGHQWAFSDNFVFGMDRLQYPKPTSLTKNMNYKPFVQFKSKNLIDVHQNLPITLKNIPERLNVGSTHKIRPMSNDFQDVHFQNNERNPLKNSNTNRQPSLENPLKGKLYRQTINENIQTIDQGKDVKNIILSQINYCRFMNFMYDEISQYGTRLPNVRDIKEHIVGLLRNKLQKIVQMVKNNLNNQNIASFNHFIKTQEWSRLKFVILKYQERFTKKYIDYNNCVIKKGDQSAIVVAIKMLRNNMQKYIRLIQLLTNCYQIEELDQRLNPLLFAKSSKIEYLITQKVIKNIEVERLEARLQNLGIWRINQ